MGQSLETLRVNLLKYKKKKGIDTKMDKNNKMHSADFNRANAVSINGWEHTWVKKRKKKNTFTLILQREGLRMYLCLINGGGGGIFAVNKLGVISQRYLPGKLTSPPHRDTT